ncbi:MAG TPA: acyl carrier protein [Anaerolineae bacterium]|nr:acyl carrier protein [Anaerolineae bacterium]
MANSGTPMSFEEFRRVLAEVLLVDEAKLTREASFLNDLMVDSIRWLEMALTIERLGVQIPTEALWDIQTVGDSYEYYLRNFVV